MKITDIEVIELRVPGWEGRTFDGSYDNCVIQVHTDAGITGLGESGSWGYLEASAQVVEKFKTYLVGQDPLRIEQVVFRQRFLQSEQR